MDIWDSVHEWRESTHPLFTRGHEFGVETLLKGESKMLSTVLNKYGTAEYQTCINCGTHNESTQTSWNACCMISYDFGSRERWDNYSLAYERDGHILTQKIETRGSLGDGIREFLKELDAKGDYVDRFTEIVMTHRSGKYVRPQKISIMSYNQFVKNFFDLGDKSKKRYLQMRFKVFKRDNYHCILCGRGVEDGVKLEMCHRIADAKGGLFVERNLFCGCFDCNRGMGVNEP